MSCGIKKINIGRYVAVLLALLMLVPLLPVTVRAAEASGECGKDVSWSLDGGVLTVSGSGAMKDYKEISLAPWNEYADLITAVNITDGVTSVGDFAFFRLPKLSAVNIASSITVIGKYSFYECTALELLALGSGVTSIEESAFEQCTALSSVRLPNTLQKIGYQAFYRCESLKGITIPASVTEIGDMAFMYCTSLVSAVVLANVSEIPTWMFCECSSLESITLSEAITSVGVQAFDNCNSLENAKYGGSGDASAHIRDQLPMVENYQDAQSVIDGSREDYFQNEEITENGSTVNTDKYYTETDNSTVFTEVTHTKGDGSHTSDVTIDATVENPDGWSDVKNSLVNALQNREYSAEKNTVNVNVHLKGESELKKEHLSYFAGKDLTLSVHTEDGATWRFNGTDIVAAELEESYKLSYTLTRLDDPTEKQREVVGGSGYLVVFDYDFNIKTELLLPLGEDLARDTAVFFAPEKKEYLRMQASIIDREGIAHFYLEKIKADIEYLIGINIPNRDAAANDPQDAIIPEELKDEYPNLEQIEPIEYVITGRKSSWGLSGNQVTLILAGVMLTSIVVVGVIVYIMFKAKHRNYYDPVLDGASEKKANAKPKKEESEPAPKKDKPESKAKKSTKKK